MISTHACLHVPCCSASRKACPTVLAVSHEVLWSSTLTAYQAVSASYGFCLQCIIKKTFPYLCGCILEYSLWLQTMQGCLDLIHRYRTALAGAAGLSVASVVLTSQQAGSIVLGTALQFPSNSSAYRSIASYLQARMLSSSSAIFSSDSAFASDYGPVTFSGFDSVGESLTAPPVMRDSELAQTEGNIDGTSAASTSHTQGREIASVEAGDIASAEYGTFIPVNGYSPPPPPPASASPPPRPGTTASTPATTAAATATTSTPSPTTASSAVGMMA